MMARRDNLVSAETETQTLVPALKSLVQAIAIHSTKGDPADYRPFRASLNEVSEALQDGQSLEDVQRVVQTAASVMQDYGQKMTRRQHGHVAELRAGIKLLLEALEGLAVARPDRMRELQEIGQRLVTGKDLDELRRDKARLSECLQEVRKEAERQTEPDGGTALDGTTGHSGRPAAESALQEASSSEEPQCVVVMLVDRMRMYNVRYGRGAGDKVLNFFSSLVRRSFEDEPRLFRWTGPVFIMIRPGSVEKVQSQTRRVLEQKMEYDLDTGSRTVLLPIVARWTVFPMMVDARLAVNKIDSYAACG